MPRKPRLSPGAATQVMSRCLNGLSLCKDNDNEDGAFFVETLRYLITAGCRCLRFPALSTKEEILQLVPSALPKQQGFQSMICTDGIGEARVQMPASDAAIKRPDSMDEAPKTF